jgi:hypothetical protein
MTPHNLTSQPQLNKSQDSVAVVGGALASGGLVGAGLAILALQLPDAWRPVAVTIVPSLSSACALGVRVIGSMIRRRYGKKLWAAEKDEIIAYADYSIIHSTKAIEKMEDERATRILLFSIARMQRIKALALSAFPCERPWLSELNNQPELLITTDTIVLEPELGENQS